MLAVVVALPACGSAAHASGGRAVAVPASAGHPFFGLDVPSGNIAAVAQVEHETGYHPTVFSVFVKLDSTNFSTAQLSAIRAAGMMPMVTLEPWSVSDVRGDTDLPQYRLTTITAGRYDQDFDRIAASVAAYHQPVYIRFAHEMNGSWYPWAAGENGNTSADYVAAWRHVHHLFTLAGATNAQWLWSPNALLGNQTAANYERLYPGNAWVDDIGLSAYGQGASAADTIDPSLTALTSVSSKPVIIAETGASGPDKVSWITSFGPYLASRRRITGFVWFNTTPETTDASGDYRFDSSPSALAAFIATLERAGVPRD
jgi:hypothetical protein